MHVPRMIATATVAGLATLGLAAAPPALAQSHVTSHLHPVSGHSAARQGDTVTVTNPGSQSSYQHSSLSLQMSATSSEGFAITNWTATELPSFLFIDFSSGLISGEVTGATGLYPVTVTATDSDGNSGSVTFNWTVFADVGTPVKNAASATCLNDQGGSVNAGNPIILWKCNNSGPNEKFSQSANPGELVVYGQCLTDPGTGKSGTKQVIEPCTGAPNQTWFHNSSNEYVLGENGLCLTDPGGATANGTKVVVKTCTNVSNQHWTGS
jgi:hypothetical protein